MKKLFTLIAFLTCLLGANAKVVVDVEVDFSKYSDISEVHWYGWGASESALARLSIQDGCLHFESTEATDPTWDCQFHPIGGVSAEVDVTYTLHFKIKGSITQNVSMLGFGTSPYDQFPITEEWVESSVEYVATSSDGNILMQCGGYVGTWDIAYLKITHEEKDEPEPEWANMLSNGDASEEWDNPDMEPTDEANGTVCAWSKEWGTNMTTNNANAGDVMTPTPHPAYIEDGVFVCHAKAVDPILYYAQDTDLGWAQRAAGEQMDDNTWQNQFWINFPRALKDGEQVKVSFRYKASQNVTVSTQDHQNTPGDYLGGGNVGNLNFTTDWQVFEKTYASAKDAHSIAFNVTGDGENWKSDMDFYFDDLSVATMVLEEGFFAAAINTNVEGAEYDYNNSVKFEVVETDPETGEPALLEGVVGTVGDASSWVNQVMISTARGNSKGFEAATLKVSGAIVNDPDVWPYYEEAKKAKMNLPVAGVWQIQIDPVGKQMNFVKLEGEEDKPALEVKPNPTEITLAGMERKEQNYDNQLWIAANRDLEEGEEILIEFDYVMTSDELEEAATEIQCHNTNTASGAPCNYQYWQIAGLTAPTFTTTEQHYSEVFTIDANSKGMRSICFNMSVVTAPVNYTIKNVVFMTNDKTEYLVDPEDEGTFAWRKIGRGGYYQYPEEPQPRVDTKPEDLDGSGKVDVTDLSLVIDYIWANDLKGDVNGDGKVDVTDLSAVIDAIWAQE